MNLQQINQIRESIGLKALPSSARDNAQKKRQNANQAARAAECRRLKSIRAKGK